MNQQIFNLVFQFANKAPLLNALGIFVAQYMAYFMVLAVLVFAFEKKNRERWFYLLETALAVILSRGLLTEIIRFFYHHPRPFDLYGFTPLIAESGNSFPSGHMAFFFAITGTLLFYNKKWGITFFILSLLMGIARIFVGVHWPYDILGGIAVGLLSAMVIHLLLRPHFNKFRKEKPSEIQG